jgi:hypothetical protein
MKIKILKNERCGMRKLVKNREFHQFSLGFIRTESVYTTKLERISELGLNMNELYEMAL